MPQPQLLLTQPQVTFPYSHCGEAKGPGLHANIDADGEAGQGLQRQLPFVQVQLSVGNAQDRPSCPWSHPPLDGASGQ
jgi:hypothetical protein